MSCLGCLGSVDVVVVAGVCWFGGWVVSLGRSGCDEFEPDVVDAWDLGVAQPSAVSVDVVAAQVGGEDHVVVG